MESELDVMEAFADVLRKRHEYAEAWKSQHQNRVVAYFCSYVPEEILYAAGILPVRVLGTHDPRSAVSANIYSWYCPFCRDCAYQALEGSYRYVDGIAGGHSCVQMRGAFDTWEKHLPLSFSHHVYIPYHVKSPHARSCVIDELKRFKHGIERWIGREISIDDLDHATDVYNTNRSLLTQLYGLRKNDAPPISGAEATEMVLAGMVMDKDDHNTMLQRALDGLRGRREAAGRGVRLMTVGTENDDVELIRLIESLGGMVVTDDYCTGTRYFETEVEAKEDRISAIAERYLRMPPCPEKDLVERSRPARLQKLAEDFRVSGVIVTHQKFCDRLAWDLPMIQETFAKIGVPVLRLECDTTIATGQVRVRVEAFMEMLSARGGR